MAKVKIKPFFVRRTQNKDGKMKIGIIAELLRKPLLECIDYAAELGADGVQLLGGHGGQGYNFTDLKDDELKAIRERCDKNQIVISAVCGDICGKSFQVAHECGKRIEVCKKVIDGTVKLVVGIVTTHIGCIPESIQDPVYPCMVTSVREVAEYARSKGCRFAIETGPELADVLKNFIETVDSEGLGVNLDPANLRGVSAEDPVYAVKTLAPYIVHTHAKDAINVHTGSAAKFYGLRNPDGSVRQIAARAAGFKEVPLGQGQVPWDEYLSALREIGYDGFLTIERECGEDPVGDIRMAVDFLKSKVK